MGSVGEAGDVPGEGDCDFYTGCDFHSGSYDLAGLELSAIGLGDLCRGVTRVGIIA